METFLIQFILWYLFAVNTFTFIIRWVDKYKARKGKRRIKEKDMLWYTSIWGFLWAIIGMSVFRHKTIKSKFLKYFWAISITWIIALIAILFYFG